MWSLAKERKPLPLALVHSETQLSLVIRRDNSEGTQTKTKNGAAVERLRWLMELVRGAVTSKKKGGEEYLPINTAGRRRQWWQLGVRVRHIRRKKRKE